MASSHISSRERLASAVRPALAAAWREGLRRTARDETATAGSRSCLVVVPHPDDEALSSGALIARKRAAGTPVEVVVVTDGSASTRSEVMSPDELAELRRHELAAACLVLGVAPEQIHGLGVPDGQLADHREDAAAEVGHILRRFAPDDVVVTSSFDRHPDHRGAALVVHDAVRALPGPRPRILEAPVWSLHDGPGLVSPWHLRRPVAVRTEGYLETKRAALAEHRSQVTNLTGEPGWSHLDLGQVERHMCPVELFIPVVLLRRDR